MKWKQLFKSSNKPLFSVIGANEQEQIQLHKLEEDIHLKYSEHLRSYLDNIGVSCVKTYALITSTRELFNAWNKAKVHKKINIKPLNGKGKGGNITLKKNRENEWICRGEVLLEADIFRHITNILMGMYSGADHDKVIIEEHIEAIPFLQHIYPFGSPDFRFLCYNNIPIMAMLRIASDRSNGSINFDYGAYAIGINISKGKLTQLFDGREYHDHHPDAMIEIYNQPIPYWKDLMRMAQNAATELPSSLICIDIALDQIKGPLIKHVDFTADLKIQLVNKKGLKHLL